MPRPYPHGGRRRPGRRPPNRFSGSSSARPRGFTGPGFKQFYDLLLPMPGGERKAFFNQISSGLVLGSGMAGAMLGFTWSGLLGAVVGFGIGAAAGGSFAERQRFYRR
jgi:hypothetical protein